MSTTALRPSTRRLPITAYFGNEVVSRSEILAWEAGARAARELRWPGFPLPTGDVEQRRAAIVEAKLALGRPEMERRLAREVRWSDRATKAFARMSGKRRRLSQIELVAGGCAAEQVPAWYEKHARADSEAVMLAACPDHHLFRPTADERYEVWETPGGSPLCSRFFFTVDETDALVTAADPAFPVQMIGAVRLADGTLIGGIRHHFRRGPRHARAAYRGVPVGGGAGRPGASPLAPRLRVRALDRSRRSGGRPCSTREHPPRGPERIGVSCVGTAHDEAAPLLGRLEEQGLLTSLLDEVATRGQALVLRGEPGIGKSRLLAEAAQTARARGMAVLTTAGVQSEARLPFAGLHQLLRPVRERAAELPAVQRAALDAAFGLTDEAAPEHFRIAMAALDLISEVAADAPLLLVVEDAHWLDRPTAEVLAFLARRIESDPIILLAASVMATRRCSAMRGYRSTGSPASMTRQPPRCSTRQLPASARGAHAGSARSGRKPARAPRASGAGGRRARRRAIGAGRPAVDRTPRACIRRPRGRPARCDSTGPARCRAQRR